MPSFCLHYNRVEFVHHEQFYLLNVIFTSCIMINFNKKKRSKERENKVK